MAAVLITDGPKITDTILIDFVTTDEDDVAINPYRVDSVVIYFIERDFVSNDFKSFTETIGEKTVTMYYTNALPTYALGNETFPAWHSADTANALIEKVDFDDEGNTLVGAFRATWSPSLSREGDYIVCYTWTPLPAAKKLSSYKSFFVYGDTPATTAIPTHFTVPGKYETLLESYLPEMFKMNLSELDLTVDVLDRFHQAVAKGFTSVEDLANQLIDLLDANVCHEAFLPYLANYFKLKLRSIDPTLWRRQIKTAIPLFKKKGTLEGLKQALAAAGFTFQKLTQFWQVVSKTTWQEGFVVMEDNQTEFKLEKTALLPVDPDNFDLQIRYVDTSDYVSLSLDYVSFENGTEDCKDCNSPCTTMTWIPDGEPGSPIPLQEGDVVRIIYKIKHTTNQALENYIRSLPLADKRDETEISNPKKNWNVRLIDKDDTMFSQVIPTLHPFAYPVVWGRIRTEFAYSENIYNMEEYNGSFRDSVNPCDIDRNFADACSDCLGSIIAIDLEIENLTNDRVSEAQEVVKDYIPFHAQIDSINYSGAINEFVLSPLEDFEYLIYHNMNENILIGQGDWDRLIPILFSEEGQLRRDMLTDNTTAVSPTSGTVFNDEIVLFSPDYRFNNTDFDYIDVSPNTQNLLEILTGPNAGSYNVDDPGTNTVKIVQGSPDTIPYPLDTAAFTFNLSNEITSDLSADIFQDDIYVFTEADQDFVALNLDTEHNSASPAKVVVTTGIYAGTYVIKDLLPNNSLLIDGFPATSNVTGLKYNITNNDGSIILLNRSTSGDGKVSVTRRGRVETINLRDDWGVLTDYVIRYNGTDYRISGFVDASTAYIKDYTGGTVAGVAIKVYKRLVNEGTGYVDVRGMYLITGVDYEAALDVQNGSNPPATPIENSSFKENFLVAIDGSFYQITAWDGTRIDLSGPKATWGLSGISKTFYIVQHSTFPVEFEGINYERMDRRGADTVTATTETISMYEMGNFAAAAMNAGHGGEVVEYIQSDESISFTVEWIDGSVTEGQL